MMSMWIVDQFFDFILSIRRNYLFSDAIYMYSIWLISPIIWCLCEELISSMVSCLREQLIYSIFSTLCRNLFLSKNCYTFQFCYVSQLVCCSSCDNIRLTLNLHVSSPFPSEIILLEEFFTFREIPLFSVLLSCPAFFFFF